MASVITLQGTSKLYAATQNLSAAVMRSQEARAVNRAAADACQDEIRRAAPVTKGITAEKGWKSIRASVEVRQKGMPAYVKYNHKNNPVGTWLEYGTAERTQKTTGRKTGRMTATNWWSRGRNASRTPVRRVLIAGYRALVEKHAS